MVYDDIDAELVIDENIFGAIETHISIRVEEAKANVNKDECFVGNTKIIDIEEVKSGESDCGDFGYDDDGALIIEKMDRVEVTWVNSPSNFYVTRLDDYPLLERIDYEMEELLDER